MSEYGEEDAVHRGSILEDTHGSGASANLAESAFDGIGGAHDLSLIRSGIAESRLYFLESIRWASGTVIPVQCLSPGKSSCRTT